MILAIALGYAALTALALAMKRHHKALAGRPDTPARLRFFRCLGWALLIAMTLLCLRLWPTGLALALVPLLLTLAGLPLIALLSYRPRLAGRLALVLPAAALAGQWL